MLKALLITIGNKSEIAKVNNGLVPYNDETIKTLTSPTYFIWDDETANNLVVPMKSFARRFKFVEDGSDNQFRTIIKK